MTRAPDAGCLVLLRWAGSAPTRSASPSFARPGPPPLPSRPLGRPISRKTRHPASDTLRVILLTAFGAAGVLGLFLCGCLLLEDLAGPPSERAYGARPPGIGERWTAFLVMGCLPLFWRFAV